ncbi:hypothetical protein PDIDSM_2006 [Penicillium digitatum]|nr:hypothetical protein PDIDSM_2006 [Penicillium digitatum]
MSTFAFQPPDLSLLQKNIFDATALTFSFGTSKLFNIAFKQMENVNAKAIIAGIMGSIFGIAHFFLQGNNKREGAIGEVINNINLNGTSKDATATIL